MPRDLKVKTVFSAQDRMSRTVTRMQSRLSRFASRAKRALKAVGRAAVMAGKFLGGALKAGFIAVAGAATGAYFAITKMTGDLDVLAKTARSINFPIEEFQEWRFVAEQSGVANTTFDKSMQKFTRTMGELKGGYGALFAALKKSDPQLLKQLKGTEDVSDALSIYLKAIGDLPSATGKAALSAAGFGRAGIDMINIANESAENIEALRAQMRENGVVTADQAAAAEEFNDTLNRVKLTLKSVFVDAVVPLLPSLTKFATTLREWAVENRAIIKTRIKEWAEKLGKAIVDGAAAFKKAWPEIKKTVEQIWEFIKGGKELISTLWDFKDVIIAVLGAVAMLKVAMMGLKLAELAGTLTSMGGAAATAAPAVKGLAGALGKGGLVAAAGAAGVAIGLLINKLIDKQQEAARGTGNQAVQLSRGLGKASDDELQQRLKMLDKKQERVNTFGGHLADILTPGAETDEAIKNIRLTRKQVQEELIRRMQGQVAQMQKDASGQTELEGLPSTRGGAPMMPEGIGPLKVAKRAKGSAPGGGTHTVVETKQETVTKEEVEVVLRDETGRADVTKQPKGKNFKLVHTGAP